MTTRTNRLTRAYVMNDGGFDYGMDSVTPVTWRFSRRPLTRNVYREWIMPDYMTAWCKANPQWVGSKNQLHRIADSLRPAAEQVPA